MLDDHLTPKVDREAEMNIWWKEKRWLYNLIVGVCGLLTIGFEYVFLVRSWSWCLKILPFVLFLGIIANLCFSMGKGIEFYIYKVYPRFYHNDLAKIIFWVGTSLTLWFIVSTEYEIYSSSLR